MNYYVLERQNDDSHPLLGWSDDDPTDAETIFARNEEFLSTQPVRLRLGRPIPKHPQLVDYHVLPEPVISEKLAAVLAPMLLHMVQLVPAVIPLDGIDHPYYLLHVRNRVECLDMRRTKYEPRLDGGIAILERIVLDEDKLRRVPEANRLLFCPQEYETIWLAHESVKNALEAVSPVGLRFFHVDDWGDTVSFR